MGLSPQRQLSRVRLLQKSAAETAALFNAKLSGGASPTPIILPTTDASVLEGIVTAYSHEVRRFKTAHRFPGGRRINNGKIAGLMTRILIRDGIDDLFVVVDPAFYGKGIDVAAGTFFVWHLACSIIAVDRDRMPADLRDDFLGAITVCDDASPELLCLALTALRTAFGDLKTRYED